MCNRRKDLKFGNKNEKIMCRKISKAMGIKLKPYKDAFSIFDFRDEAKKVVVELKSRRIRHDQYTSTFVGHNKILEGFRLIADGWKVFIVWKFNDKVRYYELVSKAQFDKECWVDVGALSRWDRGRNEISDLANIPIVYQRDLKKFPRSQNTKTPQKT